MYPIGNALSRKAAKHHRMHGTDAGTSEHGDGQFGHHGQVNANAVAFLNTFIFEHVGKLAHFGEQFFVRQDAVVFIGVVGFPDEGWLVGLRFYPTIQAVFGDVELGPFEPADVRLLEIPVEHPTPMFAPGEVRGDIGPESFRIGYRPGVCGVVFFEGSNLIGHKKHC